MDALHGVDAWLTRKIDSIAQDLTIQRYQVIENERDLDPALLDRLDRARAVLHELREQHGSLLPNGVTLKLSGNPRQTLCTIGHIHGVPMIVVGEIGLQKVWFRELDWESDRYCAAAHGLPASPTSALDAIDPCHATHYLEKKRSRGLSLLMDDDIESFRGCLQHEIGHIVRDHISPPIVRGLSILLFGTITSFLSQDSANHILALAFALLTGLALFVFYVALLSSNWYSRMEEREADHYVMQSRPDLCHALANRYKRRFHNKVLALKEKRVRDEDVIRLVTTSNATHPTDFERYIAFSQAAARHSFKKAPMRQTPSESFRNIQP